MIFLVINQNKSANKTDICRFVIFFSFETKENLEISNKNKHNKNFIVRNQLNVFKAETFICIFILFLF